MPSIILRTAQCLPLIRGLLDAFYLSTIQSSRTDQPDENCHLQNMLILEERPPFINRMLEEHDMRLFQVLHLGELHTSHILITLSMRTSTMHGMKTLVMLHTSGTTGFPKPSARTHGWAASSGKQCLLTPPTRFWLHDGLLSRMRVLRLIPPFLVSN